MNGFIKALGTGVLGSVIMAAGCCTLDSQCGAPACNKEASGPACADGDCGKDACRRCDADFDYEQLHGDHCWPEQYSRESMRRVNAALAQQMQNGTDIEQTVWAHYFKSEKDKEHELNEAGIARIKYLARKKPYIISNLNLQTSFNQELDGKRINSILDVAKISSFEPVAWNVAVVHRDAPGLFGPEGPKSITKMIGPGGGPPAYEPQIKQGFLTSGGGSPASNAPLVV